MTVSERTKWLALALLCVTQFVVVLDIAIVNVGFVNASWAGAAIAFAGLLVAIFVVRDRDFQPHELSVAEPEHAVREAA